MAFEGGSSSKKCPVYRGVLISEVQIRGVPYPIAKTTLKASEN